MTDTAGLLTPAEAQRLEERLAERERATGAQMVIAIFQSLEGENLEDFGIRLAERWRVGQKSLDNGVILIVFAQDRKLRFEVGYGLEPAIPDAEAGRIIREVIGPRFRERRYAQGLEDAVTAVFARVENRGTPPPARRDGSGVPVVGIVILVAIIAFIVFARMRGQRAAYTGGRGGWGTPMVFFPWWGGGGRGGGSWGGGSSGGGGGGFSGGGGSFGGGGASGDW